jgi:hypothetical protein
LGGYRYFFYDYMDAHGLSRYLPFFVYIKGRPEKAAYIASPMGSTKRNSASSGSPSSSSTT